MKMVVLIPKPNSKFHFGEGSLEESNYIFHSNSLFSAIVNNYIKLYGEEKFRKDLKKLKNIRLSSLFFKIKDIYLIPKPEYPRFYILKKIVEGIKPKDIKKIQFFSIKAYKEFLEGRLEWNEDKLKEIIDKQLISRKILISDDETEIIRETFKIKENESLKDAKVNLFSKIVEQKVVIDRIKNTSLEIEGKGQLYNVEFIKLHPNVEFYFLIDYQTDDKEFIERVEASIRLIEDEGLGGERSSGAGFFEKVEILELPKDFKDIFSNYNNLDYSMTLGVGIPNKNDIGKIEYYKLMEIGGYIHSASILIRPSNDSEKGKKALTTPKRNILALTEGSIVKRNFEGKTENIAPKNFKHEVYAHGKPILLPFTFKGDENGS
ncbi:type III-A CRISPR-associated RAMP protein Csm4 [Methanocaldococcus fervens]|uniref:CRISPR system Cms protein Csm4 n=1 Tax=Methanocaldococcus fervens (strain DSM 4213 / JCM 15782 / AG86) TaxID=573064 RepID=C7P8A4_METFA|nr:type III-A CRISPR-associated RAMP protein Csm4 [Methanocaldococcus fervens]ACV24786.1 CRISPR-associated RAMP protein, Csm4 family [Methanocaldococcus fervens AG86]